MKKIVVITGGTSGIGLETLNHFVKNGWKVYELSRREKGVNEEIIDETAKVVGIGAVKTINCSNGFSFGLSSKAIWNPTTNYGFFVLGVSL